MPSIFIRGELFSLMGSLPNLLKDILHWKYIIAPINLKAIHGIFAHVPIVCATQVFFFF